MPAPTAIDGCLQLRLGQHPADRLLALHALAPERFPCLLESAADGAGARHDVLLAAPGAGFRLDGDGLLRTLVGQPLAGGFLSRLDREWRALRSDRPVQPELPFRGGWALLLCYELAASIEPRLRLPQRASALPVALALRCPAAIVRDRRSGECTALIEQDAVDAALRVAALAAEFATVAPLPPLGPRPPGAGTVAEDPPDRFLDGVHRVQDYLHAGDVFQVNLSRGWSSSWPEGSDHVELYRELRDANPAPFAGLIRGSGWAVLSSSPERLVSVTGDLVQTRPIAGTRPRLAGDDDASLRAELIGHPKERAEHVMLIDLQRNDLGRVCRPGSIEVDELMVVESYAHVHHIVSNVRGRLAADRSPADVIAAVFPGGTITGCPKVRCMEIIAELEAGPRGPYTGALGYLNRDGDLDLNILIRTLWRDGDRLRFRAGAGIVADSEPLLELAETRAKAVGMLRALGEVR